MIRHRNGNLFKWSNKVFLKTPLAGINEENALIKTLAAAWLPNEAHRRRISGSDGLWSHNIKIY